MANEIRTGERDISVLYVDDDRGLTTLMKRVLERAEDGPPCRVHTETDPEAALALVREDTEQFDCVVSDYRMPGMNGVELLEAIRTEDPELPVVLFSAEETGEVAADVLRAGLTDYLRKRRGMEQYTVLLRRLERAVDRGGGFETDDAPTLDSVAVIGPDNRFERADEGFASLYGYDAEEVVGSEWTTLHPEAAVEHIRRDVLPVLADGGSWAGPTVGIRADGTTFAESATLIALDDGRLLVGVSPLDGAEETD